MGILFIVFKQTFNDCGVSFTFSCAELGGVYPFNIEVSDESGNKLESEIKVPSYHKRLDFDGDAQNILDYMFINDDKNFDCHPESKPNFKVLT